MLLVWYSHHAISYIQYSNQKVHSIKYNKVSFIHSIGMCRMRRSPAVLRNFLHSPVVYFFLPLFSTNYSSNLPHFILPSISWSASPSGCFQIHIILLWEFYFLPFSVHVQTNVIYVTLLSLLWWVFKQLYKFLY
jgi:hypothetical protein